jgi:quinoprotein glucose dehydrogenase
MLSIRFNTGNDIISTSCMVLSRCLFFSAEKMKGFAQTLAPRILKPLRWSSSTPGSHFTFRSRFLEWRSEIMIGNEAEAKADSRGAATGMAPRNVTLAVALVLLMAWGNANGQMASSPAPLPPGPGRELVARACSSCHSTQVVVQHHDTAAGWASQVDLMVGRGAMLSPAEESTVVTYLARHYPSGAPEAPAPAPQSGADGDEEPEVGPVPDRPPIAPPGLALSSKRVTPSKPNSPTRQAGADWPAMNLDPGASRYSLLTQIDVKNVGQLTDAWTWESNPKVPQTKLSMAQRLDSFNAGYSRGVPITEVAPLVVDGVLYLTTPYGQAVALEGDTGHEIWKYTLLPGQGRPGVRSLAYWPGDGTTPAAIYFSTTAGLILALEAQTGRPLQSFGKDGVLNFGAVARGKFTDLTPTVSSSPLFYKNIMITGMTAYGTGGRGPLGTTRGWDAATGKLLWEFHGVPQPGEPGHETWVGNSWMDRDGAYSWGLQSVDMETGTVFVPLSTAHFDYYGGDRPGNNLYGTSLVALDATTGKLKWYYQMTHHDLWDADLHHAPVLINVQKGIQVIPAVAIATKRGLMFMLDRNTGKPIYPVEERRFPTDGFVPTELPSATQPYPVWPGPLARDYFSPNDLNRITPEQEKFCDDMLKHGRKDLPAGPDGLRTGGPYIPYDENGSILFPWTNGGAEWEGMSYDPGLGYVFVLTADLGEVFQAIPHSTPPNVERYQFRNPHTGWPCSNGPWGEMIAVNVNTGLVAWRRPIGKDTRLEALGIRDWGTLVMGGPTSTAGGVTFAGGTIDGNLRAVESSTGKDLWQADVGASAHGITITYLGRDGRQYVAAFICGGGYLGDPAIPAVLRVFSLPKEEHPQKTGGTRSQH